MCSDLIFVIKIEIVSSREDKIQLTWMLESSAKFTSSGNPYFFLLVMYIGEMTRTGVIHIHTFFMRMYTVPSKNERLITYLSMIGSVHFQLLSLLAW